MDNPNEDAQWPTCSKKLKEELNFRGQSTLYLNGDLNVNAHMARILCQMKQN